MWIHKVLIAANILFIHLSVSSFFFFFFFLTKWLLFFVKVIISDATTLYTCHWTEYCFCTLYLHLPVGMKPSPACDRIHTAHLYTLTCNALLRLKFGERYLEKVFKSVKCKCLIPVVTLFVSSCGKTNNTFHHCYSQNFNIYKRLFLDLINLPDTDGPESYRMWGDLRNFLLQLVDHNRTEMKSTFLCGVWC